MTALEGVGTSPPCRSSIPLAVQSVHHVLRAALWGATMLQLTAWLAAEARLWSAVWLTFPFSKCLTACWELCALECSEVLTRTRPLLSSE
ncbi:rCG52580, isoform CRA_a [Rattus norvegicus]|uniref:RCG52580, isoform CRA_a n=1 Tax=Rattus norvegicus TaxID=10116 RepID=A6IRH4_RAT|nr:rCG52580, isoform CRA_a [Rattus norvegicus]